MPNHHKYRIRHPKRRDAPTKKTKKTADSINSRLALVMKSGKGTNTFPQVTLYAGVKVSLTISSQSHWTTSLPWRLSDREKRSSLSLPATARLSARVNLEYYSMLSKTNVHHFAGNTVSRDSPLSYFQRCWAWSFRLLNDQTSVCEGLPNDKVCMTLEGLTVTHIYLQNELGPLAECSSDAPQWLYWMLVIQISWVDKQLKNTSWCIFRE